MEYAMDDLGLGEDDARKFRKLCLLSEDAGYYGYHSDVGKIDDWWLRDNYFRAVKVDGVPAADDFYKGLPLRCALWRLPQGRITVRILPWTDSPLIYVEPPCRPNRTGAELHAARIVAAE